MRCGSCKQPLSFTGEIDKSEEEKYLYVYKCSDESCGEIFKLDEGQHESNRPPTVDIPVTKFDVQNRISKAAKIQTRFQTIPATEKDYANILDQKEVLDLLLQEDVDVYESGPVAQDMDLGLYIYFQTANAVGRLYIPTDPAERRTAAQLASSREAFMKGQ